MGVLPSPPLSSFLPKEILIEILNHPFKGSQICNPFPLFVTDGVNYVPPFSNHCRCVVEDRLFDVPLFLSRFQRALFLMLGSNSEGVRWVLERSEFGI